MPACRFRPAPLRIDLAVTPGLPAVADVLAAVLSEMQVERALVATEAVERAGGALPGWAGALPVAPQTLSHEEFESASRAMRAPWCGRASARPTPT